MKNLKSLKNLMNRVYGPLSVADCLCQVTESIGRLDQARDQQLAVANAQRKLAELARDRANVAQAEADHAGRVASRVREIIS